MLARLGQETAQIGLMVIRAAAIHEKASRLRIQRLCVLLVPAITVLTGAVVAVIVSAVLIATLGLNDLTG